MSNMSRMYSGSWRGCPRRERPCSGCVRPARACFGGLDALLDFADAGEVFVNFLAVPAGHFAGQAAQVALDEVEHGAFLLLADLQVLRAFLAACRPRTSARKARADSPRA